LPSPTVGSAIKEEFARETLSLLWGSIYWKILNGPMKTQVLFVITLCLVMSLSSCSKKKTASGEDQDFERGRSVYVANCVACHNNDPSKDGPLGPAIKGSPKELLEARVLHNSYPPNYQPKRPTKVMPSFPFLEPEIPYLAAYLR
jgi:mono/diheme cytochrome c family protein